MSTPPPTFTVEGKQCLVDQCKNISAKEKKSK